MCHTCRFYGESIAIIFFERTTKKVPEDVTDSDISPKFRYQFELGAVQKLENAQKVLVQKGANDLVNFETCCKTNVYFEKYILGSMYLSHSR